MHMWCLSTECILIDALFEAMKQNTWVQQYSLLTYPISTHGVRAQSHYKKNNLIIVQTELVQLTQMSEPFIHNACLSCIDGLKVGWFEHTRYAIVVVQKLASILKSHWATAPYNPLCRCPVTCMRNNGFKWHCGEKIKSEFLSSIKRRVKMMNKCCHRYFLNIFRILSFVDDVNTYSIQLQSDLEYPDPLAGTMLKCLDRESALPPGLSGRGRESRENACTWPTFNYAIT